MTLKQWLATRDPEEVELIRPILYPKPYPSFVEVGYISPLAPDDPPDDIGWNAGVRDDY